MEIARGGQAFSHMRHDSHLKMLVSGSSRRAMSPRDRSGSSRFSYGYFRVTGRGRTKCSNVRSMPPIIPLIQRPRRCEAVRSTEGPRAMGSRPEAGGTPSRKEGFGRVDSGAAESSVDISEHDVNGSEDRDRVRYESILQQPGEDLQVVEGGPA